MRALEREREREQEGKREREMKRGKGKKNATQLAASHIQHTHPPK
jgi:hypothetical protein